MRIVLPRRALVALVAGITVLGPTSPATAATAADSGRVEQEPSPQEIQQQQARVAGLRKSVEQQAVDQTDAQRALDATAQLAGQALDIAAQATRSLQLAQLAERQRTDELDQARVQVAEQRRQLGQWARSAYQNGSQVAANPTMTVLLSAEDSQDVTTGLNVLRRLGAEHSSNLEAVVSAQGQADQAADRAADATVEAERRAVEATNARRAADTAVAQQRRRLGRADSTLGRSRIQLSVAEQHQRDLEAVAARARAARVNEARTNSVTGAVGDCAGEEDVAQYGNGLIPVSALCPLRAAPEHHLRADAAYAFDRLSQAYAQQFGAEPCITDSYRSFAQQVDVYARKPNLAAKPGTSNHGWGTALDLCGGIQDFGSEQHLWMNRNAPLYGWFHPAWAEPGGSKPEPWHWEYSS